MAESANATTIPVAASIEDSGGAVWTLRMSDRAALRNGSTTSLSGVVQLWYLSGVVWAYMGSGWKSYAGSWSATSDWRTKPTGFPTTAGLRLAVGPQALASHAGVAISAGADIQAVVDANPAGTTYVLAIGTYTNQVVVPKEGDTFVGLHNGTNGAVMDGADTAGAAFFSETATYVTIRNLKMTRYVPGLQFGTVFVTGDFCTIQNCEISYSTFGSGGGVYLSQYALVIANWIHHNNQQGFMVHGDIMGYVAQVGVTLDSNDIDTNNPTEAEWSGSEQGGGKVLESQYFAAWFNYSHGNGGSGIWLDSNNIWSTIWGNRFGYNWNGVEIEISYDFQVKYNDFSEFTAPAPGLAGFFSNAAVMIGNSGGVDNSNISEISYNTFVSSQNARTIAMRQQNRILGDRYNIGVIRYVRNIYSHHNTHTWAGVTDVTDGLVGLVWDYDPDGVVSGADRVTFDYNSYTVDADFTQLWAYGFTNRTFAQWQAAGMDVNGTYSAPPAPPDPPAGWSTTYKNSRVTISGDADQIATGASGGSSNSAGRGNADTVIASQARRYWYVDITEQTGFGTGVGIANSSQTYGDAAYIGNTVNSFGWYGDGTVYREGGVYDTAPTYGEGDRLYIFVHGDDEMFLGVNAIPDLTLGTGVNIFSTGVCYPAFNVQQGGVATANFGPLETINGYTSFLQEEDDTPTEEDTNARRALEHYRLGWLRHHRRMEDEDDAWLVLQR